MRTFIGSGTHRRLLMQAALCAAVLVFARAVAMAGESVPGAASGTAEDTRIQGSRTADGPAGSAGMRIYRDPATGEFTTPPPGAAILPPASRALGTSAEGLVETPGTGAAGGVTIDLGGRFRSAVSATADDAGAVTTHCRPETPGGGKK